MRDPLIWEVFLKPLIWDKHHKDFKDRYLSEKAWDEIAEKIKLKKDVLKKKWQQMYDKFFEELNDGLEKDTSEWEHFKKLTFLKVNLLDEKPTTSSNIDSTTATRIPSLTDLKVQSTNAAENDSHVVDDENESSDGSEETKSSQFSPPQHSDEVARRFMRNSQERTITTQKKVLKKKRLKSTPVQRIRSIRFSPAVDRRRKSFAKNNEDTLFLRSLFPHIRRIPVNKKLLFRCKVQEFVHRFAYGDHSDDK